MESSKRLTKPKDMKEIFWKSSNKWTNLKICLVQELEKIYSAEVDNAILEDIGY